MGGKRFLIHFFDVNPITHSAIMKWIRCNEVKRSPWMRFKSLILMTVILGNVGFFLDVFRKRPFIRIFQVMHDLNKSRKTLLILACQVCVSLPDF
jgi:hypothetical protein